MPKFDMGAAWDDSLNLMKSHSALTGTIAAFFLFLPTLAVAWFGPPATEPAAGADFAQIMEVFQSNFRAFLPYQLAITLFTIVGTIAILRLWLARTGTSVGEALTFALMLFPTMVAIQILSGMMLGIGFLLLIIPGLYLIGRLALVAPAIADRGIYNPLTAIGESWRLTENNGWAIFFFLFLVGVVILIAALIVGGVVGIATSGGSDVARILEGLVEATFAAAGSFVSIAISAAAYRQLAASNMPKVFE